MLLASTSFAYPANPAIQLWDVATGADHGRLDGHRRPVQALAFFPDGKTLASGSVDRTVRLWDVPARRHRRTLSGLQSPVTELALIRGTDLLVASERSGTIRMWHSTAPPERDPAARVINDVIAWQFATDSRSIFTIHRDTSLSEWDIPAFERRRQIEINRPQSMRGSLVRKQIFPGGLFAPDRPLMAMGSREGIVWVFDFDQGSLLAEFKISSGWAVPTAFLDHGSRLIIYDGSRSPPVYHERDLQRGVTIATWSAPERHHESLVHTPDERYAIMLRPDDGSGLLRDIPARTSRPIRLSIDAVTSSGFSPDGYIFAATSRNGYAKLWRFPEFEEVATLSGSSYAMSAVAFAPFGGRFATGSTDDEAVRIWDIESRQAVLLLPGIGGPFHETAFSSDGAVLGSLSNSRRLYLWRAPTWREIESREKAEAAKASGR
jgi:WD40 repeat protein